jgi:hypothetical protein
MPSSEVWLSARCASRDAEVASGIARDLFEAACKPLSPAGGCRKQGFDPVGPPQARVTRLVPRLENLLSIVDEKTIGDARVSRAAPASSRPTSRRVFVVHGHDDAVRQAVARTLERLDLQPIILHEQPDKGRTIIEKLKAHKEEIGYAVVLMTPDDVGGPKGPRPNRSGRGRAGTSSWSWACSSGRSGVRGSVLYPPDVEMPSDYEGVLYKKWDGPEGKWRFELAREIHAAGIPVDLNRLLPVPGPPGRRAGCRLDGAAAARKGDVACRRHEPTGRCSTATSPAWISGSATP